MMHIDKQHRDNLIDSLPKMIQDCMESPTTYCAITIAHLIATTVPEVVCVNSMIAQLTEITDFCKQDVEYRRLLSNFENLIKNLNEVKQEIEKSGISR
jgi:dimeric dUTPase (all-alpha-NTP-PPase superfamily)